MLACYLILQKYNCQTLQEQALESSKTVRDKEWATFNSEVADKRAKVDEACQQKELDLRRHYKQLEEQLAAATD